MLDKKGSCSLIFIVSLPFLFMIGTNLCFQIYLIKQRQKTEHLCYTNTLKLNSFIANFINYTNRQHNPEVKKLLKLKKSLNKTMILTPSGPAKAALLVAIRGVKAKLKILNLQWQQKKLSSSTSFIKQRLSFKKDFKDYEPNYSDQWATLYSSLFIITIQDIANVYKINLTLAKNFLSQMHWRIKKPHIFLKTSDSFTMKCLGGIQLWKKHWLSQLKPDNLPLN